jgi:hypothetical protein
MGTNKLILIRIATALMMFCFIMWGYWWFTWCLAIGLLFYFRNYYEIIIWGIIYDAIYGISLPEYGDIRYIFTISSIILYVLAIIFRKSLTVYDDKI